MQMIAPAFEELADEVGAGAIFCKIDVDKTPELAERFEVQGMPTFVFIKNGQVAERFAGASVQKLRDVLESLL
jgi:thioredoxin 1